MYKLIQMSFDGAFVTDSQHQNLEQAEQASANLGSKWYFYPFSIIVKGQTVVEAGGSFCNMQTGEVILNSLLKGKRFKTVQNLFKKVSELEEMQGVGCDEFESTLIDALRR